MDERDRGAARQLGSAFRQARGHFCPMLLGFHLYPEGMFDNSSTFQRWVCGLGCASPEGTAEPARPVSRPFGTHCSSGLVPNVETLGYYRMSLRDNGFALRGFCGGKSSARR
jgi:hypothetical protein